MATAADSNLSDWDMGLSQATTQVVQARLSLYGDGSWADLIHAVEDLHRYVVRFKDHRVASPALRSILATVLSPVLQEFCPQESTLDLVEKLLAVLGAPARSGRPSASSAASTSDVIT